MSKNDGKKFEVLKPQNGTALRDVANEQFGGLVDNNAIGRIVQAAQEIEVARKRILNEHATIGSRLGQIYQTILAAVQKQLGDTPQADDRASTLLYAFASRALHISRGSAIKYLQAYNRFADNAEALTYLNLSELTVLKRADISDAEVQRFIDARKSDEKYSRSEIIPFIEWSRRTHQDLNSVMANLESAEEQLNESLERQRDLEVQIRHLEEEVGKADSRNVSQKDQFDRAAAALASQANTVESLQMSVDRMSKERAALQKALSESKIREVVKEVQIEVLPPELESLSAAIVDATKTLDDRNSKIAEAEARLQALNHELVRSEDKEAENRGVTLRLDGLKADLDDALTKLRGATTNVRLEHRAALISLLRSAQAFCNELLPLTSRPNIN